MHPHTLELLAHLDAQRAVLRAAFVGYHEARHAAQLRQTIEELQE